MEKTRDCSIIIFLLSLVVCYTLWRVYFPLSLVLFNPLM